MKANLFKLQTQVQDYLLEEKPAIKKAIHHSATISADQRLAIYFEGYYSRLSEALAYNYPILQKNLSRGQFAELAAAYIQTHPSSYRSIRWFGDQFPNYLAEKKLNYLVELAEFEWCLSLCFDARNSAILRLEDLATLPPTAWENLKFRAQPSLQRCDFFWPVPALWEAINNDSPLPDLIKRTTSSPYIIWRINYQTKFYQLALEEAYALDRLLAGASFGELCLSLCQWIKEEEVSLKAASLLKSWIQSGMLAAVI